MPQDDTVAVISRDYTHSSDNNIGERAKRIGANTKAVKNILVLTKHGSITLTLSYFILGWTLYSPLCVLNPSVFWFLSPVLRKVCGTFPEVRLRQDSENRCTGTGI